MKFEIDDNRLVGLTIDDDHGSGDIVKDLNIVVVDREAVPSAILGVYSSVDSARAAKSAYLEMNGKDNTRTFKTEGYLMTQVHMPVVAVFHHPVIGFRTMVLDRTSTKLMEEAHNLRDERRAAIRKLTEHELRILNIKRAPDEHALDQCVMTTGLRG